MPIFEQNYRNWEGTLKPSRFRWTPILSVGIRQTFKKKKFLLFFVSCLISVIVFGAMIVLKALIPAKLPMFSEFWEMGPRFFAMFLSVQSMFVYIITLWVGANLINNDFTSNALQLYLSRPLTPFDYIAGKFSVVFFFVFAITALPGLFLFTLRALLLADGSWLLSNYWIAFSIIGFSALMATANSLLILFCSSVTKNSRFSGISYILVVFFSAALAAMFYGLSRAKFFIYLSFSDNIETTMKFFFNIEDGAPLDDLALKMDPFISLIVLAAICLVLFRIIRKKVSKTEVIK